MIEKLKQRWHQLVQKYTNDSELIEIAWIEIENQYGQKNRAYHNLKHLESMFFELEKFVIEIDDMEAICFSIWYHDLVYNPLKKDNELRSAEKARIWLNKLGVDTQLIEKCFQQIVLTQHHNPEEDAPMDDKYLMDFDLEILSRKEEDYLMYCQQIRKEYWMYPDFIYKKGRAKAMQKFLERPYIYQTSFYRIEKEKRARENISREIAALLK